MHLRQKFWFGLVSALFVGLFGQLAFAQDDVRSVNDPQGLYTIAVPAGWDSERSSMAVTLTHESGALITVVALEGMDAAAATDSVLAVAAPGLDSEPVDVRDLPLDTGIWTQSIYALPDETFVVTIVREAEAATYLLVVGAPDLTALQTITPDLNTVLLSFTPTDTLDLTGVAPQPLTAADLADLTAYIDSAMIDYDIPGAAVAVVQGDRTIYMEGFGTTEVGGDRAVDADTHFMIGSITKSMTTLLVATLVEDGLLDWDDTVTDLLPDFALSDPDATAQITVRDLFNMSSGVPRYDVPLLLTRATPSELLATLAAVPLVADPGQTFNYSNYMVGVGGYLAAQVATDAPFDDLQAAYFDLMQTRVFDPLGMEASTFDYENALTDPNHAQGYSFNLITGERDAVDFGFEEFALPVAPAGAVWSTAADMSRYLMMQIQRGVAPDGTRIVSEENLDRMQTVEIAFPGGGYGLGWIIGDFYGVTQVGHDGGTMGFVSHLTFLPEAELGVVVLVNQALTENFAYSVSEYVFELAYDLEHTAPERYAAAEEQITTLLTQMTEPLVLETITAADAADYVGIYEDGTTIRVSDAGELVATTPFGDIVFLAVAGEPGRFVSVSGLSGATLQFDPTTGAVTVSTLLADVSGGLPYTITRAG